MRLHCNRQSFVFMWLRKSRLPYWLITHHTHTHTRLFKTMLIPTVLTIGTECCQFFVVVDLPTILCERQLQTVQGRRDRQTLPTISFRIAAALASLAFKSTKKSTDQQLYQENISAVTSLLSDAPVSAWQINIHSPLYKKQVLVFCLPCCHKEEISNKQDLEEAGLYGPHKRNRIPKQVLIYNI